jgi:hypothetical protein
VTACRIESNAHIGQLLARIRLMILLKFDTLMGEFIVIALVKVKVTLGMSNLIKPLITLPSALSNLDYPSF